MEILKSLGVLPTVSLMSDKIEVYMEGEPKEDRFEYLWVVIRRESETTMLQVSLYIEYWRIGVDIVRFVEEQSDISCSLYWRWKASGSFVAPGCVTRSIEIQVHVPALGNESRVLIMQFG